MPELEFVYDSELKMLVPKGTKRYPVGFARAIVEKQEQDQKVAEKK